MPAPAVPPGVRRRLLPLVAAALVAAVSDCARTPSRIAAPQPLPSETSRVDFPRSRLIARDFVDALRAADALDPASTTLYTAVPASRFGEILFAALQEAGYELRLGGARDGGTLDYAIAREAADGAGERYTFEIVAGGTRLRRAYRVDEDGVVPLSSMSVDLRDASHALAGGREATDAFAGTNAESRQSEDAAAPRTGTGAGVDAGTGAVTAASESDGRRRLRAAFLAGRLDGDALDEDDARERAGPAR